MPRKHCILVLLPIVPIAHHGFNDSHLLSAPLNFSCKPAAMSCIVLFISSTFAKAYVQPTR